MTDRLKLPLCLVRTALAAGDPAGVDATLVERAGRAVVWQPLKDERPGRAELATSPPPRYGFGTGVSSCSRACSSSRRERVRGRVAGCGAGGRNPVAAHPG